MPGIVGSTQMENGLHDSQDNGLEGIHENGKVTPERPAWEIELQNTDGVYLIQDIKTWLGEQFGVDLPKYESMVDALEKYALVHKIRFYVKSKEQTVFAVWTFGETMVGHPTVVHGGAAAFAFDETFGILFASLKMGLGYTAHLGVDYRKTLPATSTACLVAKLEKVDGRKVLMKAKLQDGVDGVVYSEADALFIVPKKA